MQTSTLVFLLLGVAVVVAAARIGGRLARRLGQPAVVGEIAAGIALGPSLLGLIPGDPTSWLFPHQVRPLLGALAQIGLVLFMFIVGLELDMRLVRGRGKAAATISLTSIGVPFGLGIGLALVLYPHHDIVGGHRIGFTGMALFLGIAMSITAFPVLARIMTDRGMQHTAPGVFSLAAAAVDDILAWILLALVIAVIEGGSPAAIARIVGLTAGYVAIMFAVVRPLLRRLMRWRERAGRLTPDILAVVVIGLFVSAAVTELIGVHQIFGAFVFGVVMPKVGSLQINTEIAERLEHVSVLVLLPMFFVVTGLGVDLAAIGPDGWWQLALVLVVAIGGKFAGAYVGARCSRIRGRQAAAVAVLMNTRGLTELVILSVGRELGVLSDELFAMLVVMALVTTVLTAPLLRIVYPDSVIASDVAAAERRRQAAGNRKRVMVVIANPTDSVDRLVRETTRAVDFAHGADLVLAGIVLPSRRTREVGTPAVPDFAAAADAVETLTSLSARVSGVATVCVMTRIVSATDHRVAAEIDDMAGNSDADFVLIDAGSAQLARGVTAAPVIVTSSGDGDPDDRHRGARHRGSGHQGSRPDCVSATTESGILCITDDSRSGRTAILAAVGLALHRGQPLTIATPGSRRRIRSDVTASLVDDIDLRVVSLAHGSEVHGSAANGGDANGEARLTIAPYSARSSDSPWTYTVDDHTSTSEEALDQRIARAYASDRADCANTGPGANPDPADDRDTTGTSGQIEATTPATPAATG